MPGNSDQKLAHCLKQVLKVPEVERGMDKTATVDSMVMDASEHGFYLCGLV